MSPPQQDRPLNDAECDRINAMLSRFRSESAMNSAEEIDGFFAALICSPDITKPSQYLPEIWVEKWPMTRHSLTEKKRRIS
jgi:yecA family protein